MWRLPSASRILGRSLTGVSAALPYRKFWTNHKSHPGWIRQSARHCSSKASTSVGVPQESMTPAEAKRQMRLANVDALKRRLRTEGSEVIGYSKLLEVCEGMGIAGSKEEAATFARILDETGVVLLFRDQVYLHPDKVVDLVRRAVPLALSPRNDPRLEELKQLQKKKEEIDNLAHKQVRRILWSGLGLFVAQIGLFFRLTFWELSWDVMEPITFFATTTGILVGYAYFLFTSKDPTYQDLMKRLFQSRQKKLFQKMNFNLDRLTELQNHYRFPLECCSEVTKADIK